MALARRDLEFLELLAVVGLQAILVFEASNLLGAVGGEFLGLACLGAVMALGALVLFWDRLPFVSHPVPLAPRARATRDR